MFIFDGGTLSTDWQSRIRLQDSELGGYHFHDTPALNDVLIPRLANRVTAAIEARGKRLSVYLERGHRPSS